MDSFAGIFEVLASDQHDARVASRRALVLSRDRLDARLGKFLLAARSPAEFAARFDLVADDFAGIVRVAADEVGHDNPDSLIDTLHDHYEASAKEAEKWIQDAVKKPGDLHKKLHVPEDEKIPEEKVEEAAHSDNEDLREKAQFAENVKGVGKKKDKKSAGDSGDREAYDDGEAEAAEASKPYEDMDEDEKREQDKKNSSVHVADQGNTGLGGPSPKMDKKRWTPKSVRHDQYDSGAIDTHKEKDVTESSPPKNEGPPGDIDKIDEIGGRPGKGKHTTESLPVGTGLDDAGFADNNQEMAPHTKTFGDGGQTDPVKSESLEA